MLDHAHRELKRWNASAWNWIRRSTHLWKQWNRGNCWVLQFWSDKKTAGGGYLLLWNGQLKLKGIVNKYGIPPPWQGPRLGDPNHAKDLVSQGKNKVGIWLPRWYEYNRCRDRYMRDIQSMFSRFVARIQDAVWSFKGELASDLSHECGKYKFNHFNRRCHGIVGCTPTNVPLWEIPI